MWQRMEEKCTFYITQVALEKSQDLLRCVYLVPDKKHKDRGLDNLCLVRYVQRKGDAGYFMVKRYRK